MVFGVVEDCCSWCESLVVGFEVTLHPVIFEETSDFRPSWMHLYSCFEVFVVVVSIPLRMLPSDSVVPLVGVGWVFEVVLRPVPTPLRMLPSDSVVPLV